MTEGVEATGNSFELAMEIVDMDISMVRQNLAAAEQKLKAAPDDADVRKLCGKLRKEINARELEMFRQKAGGFPTDLIHRLEVGIRLLRGGQTDEAIRELQAARADVKLRWQAQLNLGHCFKARNNWPLAQRNFEEALQCLPPGEKTMHKELLFLLAKGARRKRRSTQGHGTRQRAGQRGLQLPRHRQAGGRLAKQAEQGVVPFAPYRREITAQTVSRRCAVTGCDGSAGTVNFTSVCQRK